MKTLVLVILILAMGKSGFAGWSSNGADYIRDQNNPWFLGDQSVNYCLHVDSSYKLNKQLLSEVVSESFRDWKKFFSKYGIDRANVGSPNYQLQFVDAHSRSISLNFVEVDTCKAEQGDLEIYFGLQNQIISDTISQGGHHGAGLAVRSDFNHTSYRNGGFLWIQNFTDDRNKIKHMLLHELGHVFGMKHNSVFAMDENIAGWMFDSKLDGRFLGQIESDYWKYNLESNEYLQFFLAPSKTRVPPANSGLVSTSQIPASIRQILNLSSGKMYSAKLYFLRFASPFNSYFYKLELAIDGEDAKGLILEMNAPKDQNYDRYLSGIYTKWQDTQGNIGFSEQFIDLNPKPRTLLGSISIGAKSLAATLNLEKGVSLRIFEPSQAKWWELE